LINIDIEIQRGLMKKELRHLMIMVHIVNKVADRKCNDYVKNSIEMVYLSMVEERGCGSGFGEWRKVKRIEVGL
jgi:hypothetical protein